MFNFSILIRDKNKTLDFFSKVNESDQKKNIAQISRKVNEGGRIKKSNATY